MFASPIEVQKAFQNNDIKLVEAARVASLSTRDQERLAQRLRQGEDGKTVFADFFASNAIEKNHVHPNNALASFARSLNAVVNDLGQRLEEVGIVCIRNNAESLRLGRKLIRTLLKRLEEAG